MQVSQWGNSLAVRLPSALVKALSLKAGDDIEIEVLNQRQFGVTKSQSAADALEGLRKYRGRLPRDFRFDRLEANEGS